LVHRLPDRVARFATRVLERLEREINGVLIRTPSDG